MRTVERDARLSRLAKGGRTAHVKVARQLVEMERQSPGSRQEAIYNAWDSGKISWGQVESMLQGTVS